jgi:hypothetical protein
MGDTNLSAVVADTFTGAVTGNVTYTTVSRTTTSDGTGTGTIADAGLLQFVNVTSGGTSTILKLPTPTPGTLVMLGAAGTAFELRSSAPSTVGINGGSGSNAESAIAADTVVFALCDAATSWTAFSMIAGTTFGAVEAAG